VSDDVTEGLRVTPDLVLPAAELRWRFSRSAGPGGQSVNTTDSRVELSFDVGASRALPAPLRERALRRLSHRLVHGVITVVASEHRSQWRNREAAAARLAALLSEAVAPPARPRRATRPSAAARTRRLEAKRRRGTIKRDRRPPERD
jgi:ribosome-associated protein